MATTTPHSPAELSRRSALARRADTDPGLLDAIADDPTLATRLAVASHLSTRPDTLERLARRAAPVAAAVAGRPDCPYDLLCTLAGDPRVTVRRKVATAVTARADLDARQRLRLRTLLALAPGWDGSTGDLDDAADRLLG